MNTTGLSRRQDVAVPGSTIARVIEALVTRGRIAKGYLGVALQHVHLPAGGGGAALIVGVEAKSPADHGGLIVGDVVTGVGGERVDIEDVHAAISRAAIGTTLVLDILRGGAPRHVTVAIGERAERESE